ncbi:MAG: hypothetical protein ACYC5N_03225 [Endomicrobiales bacterium]
MNTMGVAKSRKTTGGSSSWKGRAIAGLIVLSLFLNGFIPRFDLSENSCSAVTNILASRSLLLQYFSLSVIPLKIVNTLFKERTSPPAPKPPKKQNNNGANPSSDFTLTGCDKKLSTSRHELKNTGLFSVPGGSMSSFLLPDEKAVRESAFPLPLILVSFMLFFFLLPRSSLGEEAVRAYCAREKTQL